MDHSDAQSRFAIRGNLAIEGRLHLGAVVIAGERIAEVLLDPRDGNLPETVVDAEFVAPGFIDLQVNGGFGVEVDANPEHLRALSARLPETGVTAWLPTVISSPPELYPGVLAAYGAGSDHPGAVALGFHLEGPYLSAKRAGAHPIEAIENAPDSLLSMFLNSHSVRLVSLAPERPGGIDRIRRLRQAGIVVSLGHTDASYEDFVKGIGAGATMATHLYSAMSGLHHRVPGAVGAALLDGRVVAGMIVDGVHAHRAAVGIAFRMKGPTGIALVTDMVSAAGMPTGTYHLGGRAVESDGIAVRLPDGTLAGSALTMDQAIRNLVNWKIASPAESIQMATETPAAVLGLDDRGRLITGAYADLVLLDEALRVTRTIVQGATRYDRSPR
ncbi:N-acetylglucosamine-6-phosphate deacetylase [soil metagenome]